MGGLAALVAALGGAGAAGLPTAPGAGPAGALPAVPVLGGLSGTLGSAPPVSTGETDLRTLPVRYNVGGTRFREFRSAVEAVDEVTFPDWPLPGPRTVGWCMQFMLDAAGTPRGWHNRWKADCRLQPHDAGVAAHEQVCTLLEQGCCFDQLQVVNLVTFEALLRDLQLIEERWKERVSPSDGGGGDFEASLSAYLRGPSRVHLCISPALQTFLAEQVRADTAVSKERRKAREERALLRPPKSGGPKGPKGAAEPG